jgi:hypothetical protein
MPYVAGNRRRLVGRARPGGLSSSGSMQWSSSGMLGDDAGGSVLPIVTRSAWVADVHRRGGAVVRYPTGLLKGVLAARFGGAGTSTPTAKPRYEPAPRAVRLLDTVTANIEAANSDVAAAILAAEKAAPIVAAKLLELPRDVVSSVLGIPGWLVTALLIGGGALVVRTILPTLGKH